MTGLGRFSFGGVGSARPVAAAPEHDRAEVAPGVTPLSHAPVGVRVVVTHLAGDEGFRGRLVALGLGPGASIAVTGGGPGRPRVLGLAGSRVAIDDASARRVYVRPSAAGQAFER